MLLGSIVLSFVSIGCAEVATYGENRVRDLSDIVDARYGTGFGLGLSAQFGETFRTGLGCSVEWYQRQWFGRKSVVVRDGLFAGALLVGFDGDYVRRLGPGEWSIFGDATTGSWHVLIFNMNPHWKEGFFGNQAWFTEPGGNPPSFDTGRFGGAAFLPGINGGLYFNLGEVLDFVGGLANLDMMGDDGYPKFFTPDSDADGT